MPISRNGFSAAFETTGPTVKKHLDLLTGALVVRQPQPWHQNLAKRQVKAPKVYLRDTGLLHALRPPGVKWKAGAGVRSLIGGGHERILGLKAKG